MAATMTSMINDSSKISYYVAECRRHGVKVLSPDVNDSVSMFSVGKAYYLSRYFQRPDL